MSRDKAKKPMTREEAMRRAKKRKRRRILLFTLEGILLIIVLLGAWVVFHWDNIEDVSFRTADVRANDDIDSQTMERMEGYWNIAVFGVDARNMKTLESGAQSDSNMVISINTNTGEIRIVSIYRDMFVCTSDDLSRYGKLTDNYNINGASGQVKTLNRNLDLNITDYVTVNWKAVATAIDELGGIDLEITSGELYNYNFYLDETARAIGCSYEPIYSSGYQHLSGVQAVTYARLRNTSGDDYRRTERQRLVVSLMLEKAKEASWTTLYSLAEELFDSSLISTSLSLSDVVDMLGTVSKMNIVDTVGFPYDKQSQGGGKYYVYPLGLSQNVSRLHEFLYQNEDYTPSDTVETISNYIVNYSGYGAPSN